MVSFIIIAITVVFSFIAFSNRTLFHKYKLNPYMVWHRKEWIRVLSHGFLHADWMHLAVNMFVLWSFGTNVEMQLALYTNNPVFWYVLLYVAALITAALPSVARHKNNHYYSSVGASGAVGGVLFASIFFDPLNPVFLFMIPIPIPGILFGLAYLWYSYYMVSRSTDNIDHSAHFAGSVFGFFFPLLIDIRFYEIFLSKLF